MLIFTQKFDSYVCCDDSIEAETEGFTLKATIVFDSESHIDDDDCHNPDQSVTGCNDQQQDKLLASRKAWFNEQWFYCGVVVSVSKNGVMLDDTAASSWGIEANYPGSNNDYLTDIANELSSEAIDVGKEVIQSLCEGVNHA